MSKIQIRLTRDEIRKMINEAIRSREFDDNGNSKYPEGVFSTDSEEGEAFRDYAKSYEKPDDGNSMMWNQRERKLKDTEDSVTGSNWADTLNSLEDSDEKLDKLARDEYGDDEKESQFYDKPFGDLDDVENQWKDEPGYEEDDDEDIAGINEGRVTLTEEGLRKFVSYSVAKLLKEMNLGITTHFETDPNDRPYNKYKGMKWEDYCKAKEEERKEEKERFAKEKERREKMKPNLGITTHFDGKKHEKTSEEIERDEHLFDDQYWVDKMNRSEEI